MSGGSMNYLSRKVDDVADSLAAGNNPTRQAFARHLSLVARALHEIEWADSSDTVPGEHDEPAMRKVLAVGPKPSGQEVDAVAYRTTLALTLSDWIGRRPGRRLVEVVMDAGGNMAIVHEEKL